MKGEVDRYTQDKIFVRVLQIPIMAKYCNIDTVFVYNA